MISVYLWTGEGLSERNLALLHRMKLLTKTLKGPWIAAGDWNLEPELLQSSGSGLCHGQPDVWGQALRLLPGEHFFSSRLPRRTNLVRRGGTPTSSS